MPLASSSLEKTGFISHTKFKQADFCFLKKKTFNAWRGGNKFKEKPSSLSATTRRSDDTKSIEAIERNELVNVLTEIISKQNL